MHNIKPFVDEKLKWIAKKHKGEPKEILAFITLGRLQSKLGSVSKEVAKEFGYCKKEELMEPMCAGRKLSGLIIRSFMLGELLGFDMNKEIEGKMKMAKQKMAMKMAAEKEPTLKISKRKPAKRK